MISNSHKGQDFGPHNKHKKTGTVGKYLHGDTTVIGEPRHKISSKEKTDSNYGVACIDYYINNCSFTNRYTRELDALYKAAEGIIDHDSYEYVLNPTNTENQQLTRHPARLRNYDIIGPVINLFMGENGRRPDDALVMNNTPDSVNKFKQAKNQVHAGLLAQDFINHLNDAGLDTGVPSQEIPDYKEAEKNFDLSYDDKRAMYGQEALDFIKSSLDFDDKIQESMYDWLVAGYTVSHKEVYMDDVRYTIWDPRNVAIIGMPDSGYIEDAQCVVGKMMLSRSQLMDLFNEELSNGKFDDGTSYLDWVELYTGSSDYTVYSNMSSERLDESEYSETDDFKYLVYLVTWKGMKKEGILNYVDPVTGQVAEMVVDDTYKLDKEHGDIDIEWEWVECWYQGYNIEDTLYLRVEEGIVQRNEINNNSSCKLPFNGRIRGYRNRTIQSVAKLGLNYNLLYNVVHFRFEYMLAKNKDKILMFPTGLIPNKPGWDEDKWFYWANAHGIGWYDETAPNATTAIQGMKAVDMGLGQYIASMWELLNAIKTEWWDAVGINRQRYGDTYASDGKANTEQAIFRSALITDDMFRQFNKFLEKDYEGLLDFSKVAWIDGKQGAYVSSDGRNAFFEIDGYEHMETEYGINVVNTQDVKEKLDAAKNLLHTFGQNGMKADSAVDILFTNSISKIKQYAKESVRLEQELQEQTDNANRESAERIQASQSQDKARESEDKRYVADVGANADIEVALIQAKSKLADIYSDTINNNKEMFEELGKDTMNSLDDRYKQLNNEFNQTKQNLEKQKLHAQHRRDATQMKIAKENKNKHDK